MVLKVSNIWAHYLSLEGATGTAQHKPEHWCPVTLVANSSSINASLFDGVGFFFSDYIFIEMLCCSAKDTIFLLICPFFLLLFFCIFLSSTSVCSFSFISTFSLICFCFPHSRSSWVSLFISQESVKLALGCCVCVHVHVCVFVCVLAESNNIFQSYSDWETNSFARKLSMKRGCGVSFLNSLIAAVGNCLLSIEWWRTAVDCSWGLSHMDPRIDHYWFSTLSPFQHCYTISC